MKSKKIFSLCVMVFVVLLSGCGGSAGSSSSSSAYAPEMVETGGVKYDQTCSACHGIDLQGVENLGKNLVDSEFVNSQSDDELLTMIKTGRPTGHELNSTGIDMPPKGGNPALGDDDIMAIIAYIRTSK
jgi:disulfide bond formation protein DsbB